MKFACTQDHAHLLALAFLSPVVLIGCSQNTESAPPPSASIAQPQQASPSRHAIAHWLSTFRLPAKATRGPNGIPVRAARNAPTRWLAVIPPATSPAWQVTSPAYRQATNLDDAPGHLRLSLPVRSSGAVIIDHPQGKLSLSFRLENAPSAELDTSSGYALYSSAKQSKHWLHRLTPTSLEDFVIFDTQPEREELVYQIDVSKVAGLRLVSGILEFLDPSGTPRLRVSAPAVVDAAHKRLRPTVNLEGCAYDTNPQAPWDRPVVAPASPTCTLRIGWKDAKLLYPVLVDPSWTSTASMAAARDSHVAAKLDNGRVVVFGGSDATSILDSGEIYDPDSATWAATDKMTAPKWGHAAVSLPGNRVLIVGGTDNDGPISNVDIYTYATGKVTPGPAMADARSGPAANAILGTKPPITTAVLVSGGEQAPAPGETPVAIASSELFDVETMTWTSVGKLPTRKAWHTTVHLSGGDILESGGLDANNASSDDVSIYTTLTKQWHAKAPMGTSRRYHMAILLKNGKVLLAGGLNNVGDINTGAEIYDPISNTHTAADSAPLEKVAWAAGVLAGTNKFIAVGGTSSFQYSPTNRTIFFDLEANTFSFGPNLSVPRLWATATALDTSRVLAVGGNDYHDNYYSSAEILRLDKNGTPCKDASSCESAFCVEGVCCNDACDQVCKTCLASKKQPNQTHPGDGICGPSKTEPNPGCATQAAYTCGTNGYCDGKGACAHYPADTPCQSCSKGVLTKGACAGANTCTAATTDSCGLYACQDAFVCKTKCTTSSDCLAGAFCNPSNECVATFKDGAVCSAPHQCQSGNCVDGTCCNTACSELCVACTKKLKGVGADGTCGPTLAGTDPQNHCADQGAPGCQGTNGLCDGQGMCQKYTPQQCTPQVCKNNLQCASGFCVNGICCNKKCDAPCEACTAALKGHGVDGLCETVLPDTDPKDQCAKASNPCLADGLCDETGQCRAHAKKDTRCHSSCSNSIAWVGSCDGTGNCAQTKTDCVPFICEGDACGTTCVDSTHCVQGYYCKLGACTPKLEQKSPCESGDQCISGNCVDKVCCSSKCGAQCEACNVAGHVGDCHPVTGSPVGDRPSCPAPTENGICAHKACNGKDTAACSFVGNTVACIEESCQNGMHTFAASCTGKGTCQDRLVQKCEPFTCGTDKRCKTQCSKDADCASKFECDLARGDCVARTLQCKNDRTLVDPEGVSTDCSPYRCAANACKSSCSSTADCIEKYQCDNGVCVALPADESVSDAGCGCHTAPSSGGKFGSAAAWLLLASLWIRKRASQRRAHTN